MADPAPRQLNALDAMRVQAQTELRSQAMANGQQAPAMPVRGPDPQLPPPGQGLRLNVAPPDPEEATAEPGAGNDLAAQTAALAPAMTAEFDAAAKGQPIPSNTQGAAPDMKYPAPPAELAPVLADASKELGVPGLAESQAFRESSYKTDVDGPKAGDNQAHGLFQFTKATGDTWSKRMGKPMDPKNPKDAAAMYVAQMKENFKATGNWQKAVAMYNSTPSHLHWAEQQAATKGGNWLDYMPAETRAYVQKIFGASNAP